MADLPGAAIRIRSTAVGDHDAIRRINAAAFGQRDEAVLVDRLRADGEVLVELIAEAEASIVGHILFSRLPLVGEVDTIEAAALAPMAVAPARQHAGVGSQLVAQGLRACAEAGVAAVVVLGHRSYYPRFGFDPQMALRLAAPYSGPSFMALELKAGALARPRRAQYAAAFQALG
jgi:putative acetyltransferase